MGYLSVTFVCLNIEIQVKYYMVRIRCQTPLIISICTVIYLFLQNLLLQIVNVMFAVHKWHSDSCFGVTRCSDIQN